MRVPFTTELGIHATGENSETGVHYLHGSGVPGGDAGLQDGAEIGSLYQRTDIPEGYLKVASTNATTDWIRVATVSDILALSWRSEKVVALTGDTAPISGGTIDLSTAPFSDDDAPTLAGSDFVVGDYVLFANKLMKVTVIGGTGDTLTFVDATDPIANNDMFIVRNYLPDSPNAQEKQAVVLYNGTSFIKVSDFNWDIADGINLTSGYAAGNGSISSADTVNSAIQKLDGNQQDLQTLSGVAQGSTDLGTFTGTTIQDNRNDKQALQDLETALESLEGNSQAAGVTTITTLDSVKVDDILGCEWEVHMREDATPANVKMIKVFATHNGTAAADATSTDSTVFGKLKLGSNFNASVSVDVNGTAAAQTMRLRVASTSAGVTFTAKRIEVK